MKIVDNVWEAAELFPGLVLTAGSFDGVHLGHQRILSMLMDSARELSGTAGVMTFRPHPREFFSPQSAPNLLTPDAKKFALIEEAGADVLFVLPFDQTVADMDRADFVTQILCERCHVRRVLVGHDFRFGRDALGDYHFLKQMGARLHFDVVQAEPLYIEGERVSSTAIRESVLLGDLDKARLFLGRPFSMIGEVTSGRGIGHQLGFPTANIKPYHTAVPPNGVYAAEVKVGNQVWPAAVNIGVAPTIRHEDTVIEAHVMDFSGELKGREIEVIFHKRLRPERRFDTRDDLIQAIGADIRAVRDTLRSRQGEH